MPRFPRAVFCFVVQYNFYLETFFLLGLRFIRVSIVGGVSRWTIRSGISHDFSREQRHLPTDGLTVGGRIRGKSAYDQSFREGTNFSL